MMARHNKPLAFIDTETTGLNENHNEMIEFAGVKRITTGTGEVFEEELEMKIQMLHPDRAHPRALAVNNYSEEEWAGADHPREAALRIKEFLKGTLVVGHNVPFDMRFVKATLMREHGEDAAHGLPYHHLDTMSLAYEHLVPCGLGSVSLQNICEFLGISNEGSHRAMVDVRRTMTVFDTLLRATEEDRERWRNKLS
jgi:DNA polymerase III epsilon subunit-like protein